MKSFAAKLENYVQEIREEDRRKTRREIEAIIESGAVSYRDWLALIANPQADPEFRRIACWVIGQVGDGYAFSALGHALQDKNPQVRGDAAGTLVHLRARLKRVRYPKIVDVLVHTFRSDPDLNVRLQVAFALREFHDPHTLEVLMAVVSDRSEPDPVRDVAAEALAYIPDVRVIGAMLEVLNDPAEAVRISAAYTLSSLAGAYLNGFFTGSDVFRELQRTVLPLIEALQDPSEKVRYWVAYALGELRDPRAIPQLQRVADTDKGSWYGEEVAEAARSAIERIQSQPPE